MFQTMFNIPFISIWFHEVWWLRIFIVCLWPDKTSNCSWRVTQEQVRTFLIYRITLDEDHSVNHLLKFIFYLLVEFHLLTSQRCLQSIGPPVSFFMGSTLYVISCNIGQRGGMVIKNKKNIPNRYRKKCDLIRSSSVAVHYW